MRRGAFADLATWSMARNRTTLAGILAASVLVLTACGGSDGDSSTDVVVTVAEPTDDASDDGGSEPVPLPATVEVPAGWDPLVPADPIPGVGLTFADKRDFDADTFIYGLQYDGTDQDAEELYNYYEALALAAGWSELARSTPIIGSYSQGDRTMAITAFGGTNSQIIVSVIPN